MSELARTQRQPRHHAHQAHSGRNTPRMPASPRSLDRDRRLGGDRRCTVVSTDGAPCGPRRHSASGRLSRLESGCDSDRFSEADDSDSRTHPGCGRKWQSVGSPLYHPPQPPGSRKGPGRSVRTPSSLVLVHTSTAASPLSAWKDRTQLRT